MPPLHNYIDPDSADLRNAVPDKPNAVPSTNQVPPDTFPFKSDTSSSDLEIAQNTGNNNLESESCMELATLLKRDPDHSDSSRNSVGTTTGRKLQRQACGDWRDRINNLINSLFGDDPQTRTAPRENSERRAHKEGGGLK
ncbi:hypothetical protein MMC22_002560 [Lobaria immixta]|nr:hypothetical protein [Lobaria immixta]